MVNIDFSALEARVATLLPHDRHPARLHFTGNSWVTSINLWPGDVGHFDTCMFFPTVRRPSSRQLRRMKKVAKRGYRVGRVRDVSITGRIIK